MYTTTNFRTKKALVERFETGKELYVYQPGPFGMQAEGRGEITTCYLEGPHYPEPHKWYAQGTYDPASMHLLTVKGSKAKWAKNDRGTWEFVPAPVKA